MNYRGRWGGKVAIAAFVASLIIFSPALLPSQATPPQSSLPAPAATPPQNLPLLQVYPLPPQLERWQDSEQQGDYFDAIKPTAVGYLIWSSFPIKVYIEPPNDPADRRFQGWFKAVETAVTEWNQYLPLERVAEREVADIICLRSRPPLRATLNRQTRTFEFPTARNAEASYKLYWRGNNPSTLVHRFTLEISPNQTDAFTLATARHELGHALGIWGHSPDPADALYDTQVNNPPPISARDINTLKKIYQQQTRLGGSL
ncbi:peptidase [Oscillatoria sp. FACHB-1406]|uniref:peptidase n=1 Tax=Oscillatoria sp. FACHB-1406 TaxID=2692846 RepID=UPI001F55A566|nr:peptidase [Oscillatoria sp. FACHB-1406]